MPPDVRSRSRAWRKRVSPPPEPSPRPGERLAISAGLADVRRTPDPQSERVTQAHINTAACCLEVVAGWARVELPDYAGWVRLAHLGIRPRAGDTVAVVTAPLAPIYAAPAGTAVLETACVGAVLPVARDRTSIREECDRVAVRLPGGRRGWIARSDSALRPQAEPFAPAGPGEALDLARSLLGTPYLWGGTSPRGVDCSGLVQLSYRVAGYSLPRDADPQYRGIPYVVERGDLQPGDLLFFAARGAIDHVGLSLGGDRVLHASGSARCVTINSLDPADADYAPRLAQMYAGARRPVPTRRAGSAANGPAGE